MLKKQHAFPLTLCLLALTTGCRVIPGTYHGKDVLLEKQGTWNPAALSGGKITDYTPLPGLPREPTAKEMLEACRFYNFPSKAAKSAVVEFRTQEQGHTPGAHALVVGSIILVDPGDVTRQGFSYADVSPTNIYHNGPMRFGQWIAFHSHTISPPIVFTAGSKWATVGTQRVRLQYPPQGVYVSRADDQPVLEWTDWLRLIKVRDAQRGQSATPSIKAWRIVYHTDMIERGEPWHIVK